MKHSNKNSSGVFFCLYLTIQSIVNQMARTATVVKTNTIRLSFPFNKDILDRIKKLSGRKWVADVKSWDVTVDFRNCFELQRIIQEENFLSSKEEQKIIDFFKAEAKEMVSGKPKATYSLLEVPKTVNATLRPYQIEGFSAAIHWIKSINGCEMGLGKTLMSLVAVEYRGNFPVLIVCPASLKYNWDAEIQKFLPNRTAKILDSKEIIYSGYDFYIINYDILKKRLKDLEKLNFKFMLVDECHYIKNAKSQRSVATVKLIKSIPYVILLSGTIIENRPSELISPIVALDKMVELGGYWSFIHRYCAAKSNGFGLDISGAQNIKELYVRMAKSFYFRRNKIDVAKDLPPKIYSNVLVNISNPKEYAHAENNLVDFLQNKIFEKKELKAAIKGLSKEDKIEYITLMLEEQEEKVNSAEHLVLMTTLRKTTGHGKIEPAKEWVLNFLDSTNEKLLVFAWHTEVVQELAKEFNCDAIYGGVNIKKRHEIVDKFQNDDKVRVLVLNIKAGGVGINLTKSSSVLFIEEPFNPALKLQAEDRSHRIGQTAEVINIYTMVGKNTIDEDIRVLVEEKLQVVNAVNSGSDFNEAGSDLDVLKDLLKKLAEK